MAQNFNQKWFIDRWTLHIGELYEFYCPPIGIGMNGLLDRYLQMVLVQGIL